MSHYIKVQTKFRDRAALVQALREQFPTATIEELEQPTPIELYSRRPGHPCTIIVRKAKSLAEVRQSVGSKFERPYFGDLGFALEADGSYSQHGDDSDQGQGTYDGIAQRYARAVTIKQARLSGFTVNEMKAADGSINLTLSKWS